MRLRLVYQTYINNSHVNAICGDAEQQFKSLPNLIYLLLLRKVRSKMLKSVFSKGVWKFFYQSSENHKSFLDIASWTRLVTFKRWVYACSMNRTSMNTKWMWCADMCFNDSKAFWFLVKFTKIGEEVRKNVENGFLRPSLKTFFLKFWMQ